MSLQRARCLSVCASVALLVGCGPEAVLPSFPAGNALATRTPNASEGRALWGASVTPVGPGRVAVADTDGDTAWVIDTRSGAAAPLHFARGSRPARIAPMGEDEFAVVLRGRGEVATVHRGAVRRVVAACDEARGAAWDAANRRLLVACAGGELVALSGAERQVFRVGEELRDVLVVAGRVWVTTFRSAELLELDADGAVVTRLAPAPLLLPRLAADGPVTLSFTPRVAWRTVAVGSRVVMAHQEHLDDDVTLLTSTPAPPRTPPPYYGTGPGCGTSVVMSALTVFDLEHRTTQSTTVVPGSLPLDVAADGARIALVTAGSGGVQEVPWPSSASSCASVLPSVTTPTPVGVGLVDGSLVVLDHGGTVVTKGDTVRELKLRPPGGELPAPSALFHGQSPSGVACASCHAEGFDDGHTWRFEGGPVRTQVVAGGVTKTAPFHWRGELKNLDALLHTTFEQRMGGVRDPALTTRALGAWLDALPARGGTAADVSAGEAVFQASGCGSCHAGPQLTNNATVDVGTGGAFQVPSLRGLRWRGPWMHDGCAKTLAARFDPACGGAQHGAVAEQDVPDLIQYLESL